MIKSYVLITLRNLLKNKLFVFINVFGLGIAIACCVTAYLNWNFDASFDGDQKNAGSIYRVQFWHEFQGRRDRFAIAPLPLGNYVRQNFKEVDQVVRYIPADGIIRIGDELFNTSIGYADSSFFDLFTFQFLVGEPDALKDKGRMLISDEFAIKFFGTTNAVGKSLSQIIQGKPKEFTVGAVFKKKPQNSSFCFVDAFTQYDNYWDTTTDPDVQESSWKKWNTLFLLIRDPMNVKRVNKELQAYVEPQNKVREDFKIQEYYLENFEGMSRRGRDERVNANWLRNGLPKAAVIAPSLMAGLLLLLACFNFTNTSIAISSKRLKEIGIRKVMGGLRSQLILQFLGENLFLCVLALGVGLLMAEIMVPAYDDMWLWLDLRISYSENAGFLIFLTCLLLATGLVAGSYPALYITSFEPVSILKGKLRFGGTNWFTRVLMTLQFSISLIGIISGFAFYGNALYQKNYDLGFVTKGVVSVWINGENDFNTYSNSLAANKDITFISGTKNHIATSFYNDPVKYESLEREVDILDIGDNYLEAMGMTLLSGRGFRKDSQTDYKESILVSEELVKSFGWTDNPVGKRIVWGDTVSLYVIGVVRDVYSSALWAPVKPCMFRYIAPAKYEQMIVSASPENIVHVNDFMKQEWKKIFPNTLYTGRFIDEVLQETNDINKNVLKMFGFLGVIAAILSATGLFTLVSLNILKKMKEIGVRKVMGASLTNIAKVINLEFVLILLSASLVGGGLGYFMIDLLMKSIWEYYLHVGPGVIGISILVMFGVAALAVGWKTYNTASMNPVRTLREE
jgi:putative ABC transport system permease protein